MNVAVQSSPEIQVGFFRNMYNNARDAFNHMDEYSSPVLGYFCVMGGAVVAAAGYLLADGVVSGSISEVAFGAAAPVGAKYVHATGSELLRRKKAPPMHPEVVPPENFLQELAGDVKDALDRASIQGLMREQDLSTDGKPIGEYLDAGIEELEDFANGDEQA